MSGQQHQSNVEGIEALIPTKQALRSLKSDVTRATAIKELVDNALDSWKRNSERMKSATIEVFAERDDEEDRTELVVRDNTGGVRREDAKVVFTLGASTNEGGLIGTYGLGASKALMNLGIPFTIASHHENEDAGWQYTITQDWVDDDENWEVEVTQTDDLEPGITELRVHDLNYRWFPSEDDEDDEGKTMPELLRDDFARTYNLFLSDALGDEEFDLTIEVQGEPVKPLGAPDWSFSPIDSMFPRRFENIEIDLDGWATTTVTITVGLLRKADYRTAGVDVYCQGRQVVYAARDERVGFGRSLSEFDPQHDGRFKAIVEMETTGSGQDLPWDTQKNDLDPHNPIMEAVQNRLGRMAGDYLTLKDGRVPEAFVEPYPPSDPHAANGGKVKVHDWSDRTRVTGNYRPNTKQPELKAIKKKAEAHATLRFRCERDLDEDQVPAYKHHVAKQIDGAYPDLVELEVDPVDLDEDKADDIAGSIEKLAERHVEAGIRYSADLPVWQVPKYDDYFPTAVLEAGVDPDTIEEPEEAPADVPTNLDELGGGDDTDDDVVDLDADEDEGPEVEETDEETVEVVVRVLMDSEGLEASIADMSLSEAIDKLGLDDDADRDDVATELGRRVNIALEI